MMTAQDNVFLLKDVDAKLPLLRSIVQSIIGIWDAIIEKRKLFQLLQQQVKDYPNSEELKANLETIKEELNGQIDKINSYIKEIEAEGGFVEEFKRGIINFKVIVYKRVVFASCQILKEDSFFYFHELDECFADRRPIPVVVNNGKQ